MVWCNSTTVSTKCKKPTINYKTPLAKNHTVPFTLQTTISEAQGSSAYTQKETTNPNGINRTCLGYISIPPTWHLNNEKYMKNTVWNLTRGWSLPLACHLQRSVAEDGSEKTEHTGSFPWQLPSVRWLRIHEVQLYLFNTCQSTSHASLKEWPWTGM